MMNNKEAPCNGQAATVMSSSSSSYRDEPNHEATLGGVTDLDYADHFLSPKKKPRQKGRRYLLLVAVGLLIGLVVTVKRRKVAFRDPSHSAAANDGTNVEEEEEQEQQLEGGNKKRIKNKTEDDIPDETSLFGLIATARPSAAPTAEPTSEPSLSNVVSDETPPGP